MKTLVYCAAAAVVGALIWGVLLVYPLSSGFLHRPGTFVDDSTPGMTPWPGQLAALVIAAVCTALVFRPVIRRMEGRWQPVFVSALFVLAGSATGGCLLFMLTWVPDVLRSGLEGQVDAVGAVLLVLMGCITGLMIGVAFLPVGIPIGLGATLAMRRIAGRVEST